MLKTYWDNKQQEGREKCAVRVCGSGVVVVVRACVCG